MSPEPWPRAILHLDMDAFFVNVHLLDHPEDTGQPVAIGGRPDKRGVVASASYEARQFGVRSAMPMARAVRLCPQLRIVGANWTRIKACSRQVMAILAEYGPVEPMSVDEAYVDLSAEPAPEGLVTVIPERVAAATGLPASVGLATSKLVAKIASDHDKPAGRTIVRPGEEAAFLAPLPVRVIWGIGPRTAEQLAAIGITTCGQLAAAATAVLYPAVGRAAASLQRRAQGIDERAVVPDRGQPKSISSERTFDRDVNDPAYLQDRLQKMCVEVGESLRRQGLQAHTVTVKFRWPDFTTITRQKTVDWAIEADEEIYRLALAIWQEHWPAGQRMRLLGVGVSHLDQSGHSRQLRLDL